jgi:hypothetical protein
MLFIMGMIILLALELHYKVLLLILMHFYNIMAKIKQYF